VQHGGVLVGMLVVALGASLTAKRAGSLPMWTAGGCIASAASLLVLAAGAFAGPDWPLRACVFVLGVSNGAYAIAAIGTMMALAGRGRDAGEGVRMGVWGAAQATAFGIGGLVGAGSVDLFKLLIGTPQSAYALTFAIEALAFLGSAAMALAILRRARSIRTSEPVTFATLGQAMLQPDAGKA
jgi:BCD family chlorophyll transporter-like MFS transporter